MAGERREGYDGQVHGRIMTTMPIRGGIISLLSTISCTLGVLERAPNRPDGKASGRRRG